MTAAQMTFYAVTAGASALGTAALYPGIRTHAQTAKNALLAAFMAAVLASTALAFVVSAVVNAVTS
jgi:hypothetical protein